MTDHEQLMSQARDVLMQQRATDGVYVAPDGRRTPCRLMLDGFRTDRSGKDVDRKIAERCTGVLPVDPAAGGVAVIEVAGHFEAAGKTWAIDTIPIGETGMHRVELVRDSATTRGGRR